MTSASPATAQTTAIWWRCRRRGSGSLRGFASEASSERDAQEHLCGPRQLTVVGQAVQRVIGLVRAGHEALIGAVVSDVEEIERCIELQAIDHELPADTNVPDVQQSCS